MKRIMTVLASAVALPAISACDLQADGNDMAAGTNQQEASGQDAMMDDPSNPFAEAEMQMHDRMMAAGAADVSESWARKMIEHHRGAIAMSNILLANGGDPRIEAAASEVIEVQTREIAELEMMLGEGDGATASRPPAAAPAAATSNRAAPAPRQNAAPSPPEGPPPTPPADPMAGHDMGNMSEMPPN